MSAGFEEIDHTADIAIRAWGRDLGELFASAAHGMACQLTDASGVVQTTEYAIELEAYDAETLLVAWLAELLYLGERDDLVFTDYDIIEATPTRIRAVVRGGPARQHDRHIKAVTFSEMDIVRTARGHETTVVFDV